MSAMIDGLAPSRCSTSTAHNIHSYQLQPMITENVNKHTILCQLEKPPKVSFDECCQYCERYRDGAITPLKKMEIESWRYTVSYLNPYNNIYKRTGSAPFRRTGSSLYTISTNKRTGSSTSRKSHITMSSYKYSPPGSPEPGEPGFRRIKISTDLKKQMGKLHFERDRQKGGPRKKKTTESVDLYRLNADVASMSMDYHSERKNVSPSNIDDLPTTWKQNWPERVPKDKIPKISPRSKQVKNKDRTVAIAETAESTSSLSSSSNGSSNSEPFRSRDSYSEKDGYRTCSNDLLNVISIDDYAMRLKRKEEDLIKGGPVKSAGSSNMRMNNAALMNRSKYDQYQSTRYRSPTESGYNSEHDVFYRNADQNEAVSKAFDAMLSPESDATNSHAHKGLYKYEKGCKDSVAKPPESRRFKRMNKALHDWIESEIITPHTTATYYKSRPSTESSSMRSVTSSQRPRSIKSTQDSSSGGALLGMLIEMDENNDSDPKNPTSVKY